MEFIFTGPDGESLESGHVLANGDHVTIEDPIGHDLRRIELGQLVPVGGSSTPPASLALPAGDTTPKEPVADASGT